MRSLKYFRAKTISLEIRNCDKQPAMGKPVLTVLLLLMNVAGCARQAEQSVLPTTGETQDTPDTKPGVDEYPKRVPSTSPSEQTDLTVSTTTATTPETTSTVKSSERPAKSSPHASDQPVPGSPDGLSARQVQQQATNGLKHAKQRANQGDYTQAFKQASSAWFILQSHQDNPENQRLAKELQQVMENYAEKLNKQATQKATPTQSRKPLTVE